MFVETRRRAELAAVVFSQIPRDLRDKIALDVQTDAYLIAPTVVVHDKQGRKFQVHLEEQDLEGVPVLCKIPDTFLALLCIQVV